MNKASLFRVILIKRMQNLFLNILFVVICLVANVEADPIFSDLNDWPLTDFSQYSYPLDEFIEGGPGKDGIPAIDQPNFDNIEQAEAWLDAREPLIAFTSRNEARAYPLQILMYHEMVNDEVDGQVIAVTYCPLCNAAMVFSRNVNNQVLEFGISGKVHTSNMVMFDRQTESWWLQFTGQGVVGDFTGVQLELLPSQIVSFEQFKKAYPNGLVLNRETGFNKKYGLNPYQEYDSRDLPMPWFFRKTLDNRLPAMERVLGVVIGEQATAFPFTYLNKHPLVLTSLNENEVIVINAPGMASPVDKRKIRESKDVLAAAAYSRVLDGQVLDFEIVGEKIIDKQTQSTWNMFAEAVEGKLKGKRLRQIDRGVYFAFVWLDFYPHTKIQGANR